MEQTHISDFGEILLYIVGSILFMGVALLAAMLLRPHRPNVEKNTTYECGENPTGTAWGQFNVRFYVIALIFILFDVELVFLFPWSVVFGQKELIEGTNGVWGWFSLVEMGLFLAILVIGLAYAWAKGYLNWIKPEVKLPDFKSKIPAEAYKKYNVEA